MTAITRPELPGLSVSVPSSWRRRRDPRLGDHGVVVSARAPSLPASGVRPELTVRVACVDHDDAALWRRRTLAELATALEDFALEDEDVYDLGGYDVHYHRWAHRLGAADVLCDQWAWLVEGPGVRRGVTLTCAAAREDYPDYCDLFEAVAETVELTR
jgi:hypothetical protein